MKVVLVGTGSMRGEYNSASFLIDNDTLVDIPNGMCKNLYKIGKLPSEINNVLITHFHGDHYFDIPFYLLEKSKSNSKRVKIYLSKDGIKKCKSLLKLAFKNPSKEIMNYLKPDFITKDDFKINSYKVEKLLVDHGRQKPCYGYIFDTGKNKVGFTGDTTICDNVKYMSNMCSYMLIKGTDKHMGIDMFKDLIKEYPKTCFIPVHMDNETRDKLKELDFNNVLVCNDYDSIDIK